jgi:hypothetical protein
VGVNPVRVQVPPSAPFLFYVPSELGEYRWTPPFTDQVVSMFAFIQLEGLIRKAQPSAQCVYDRSVCGGEHVRIDLQRCGCVAMPKTL